MGASHSAKPFATLYVVDVDSTLTLALVSVRELYEMYVVYEVPL